MTKIRTQSNETQFVLEVEGHTGYGNVGSDILCSAVSVLVQTLIAVVEDVADDSKVEIHDGYALVCAKGEQAVDAYRYAMTGLNLLQINYPRFIKIEGYPKLLKPF